MSEVDPDLRLMLKACHQYYRRGLTHTEIAANIGTTRFAVARMLKTALDDGLVTVKILEPESLHPDLEHAIEDEYDVRAALVIDDEDLTSEEIKNRVADAAGRYLLQTAGDGDVVGVSLGTTIQALIDQLPVRMARQVEVVQLVGGHSTVLSALLAARSKTRPYLLHAPAVVSDRAVRDLLLSDQENQSTVRMFKQVSIAVLGIGSLTRDATSRLLVEGIIDARLHRRLVSQGAVGDVLAYVFDAGGHIIPTGLEDRVIGISLPEFRQIPLRVGVAAGVSKASAIVGALRGGLVNVIVLDARAGEAILDGRQMQDGKSTTRRSPS
jgi:DNA-binding transcriptional regulator LsrR (DeoR family)